MKKAAPARPGGRSERVKTAVFDAVEHLIADNTGELPSMAAIAERAGVNPTSLYRRWGDVNILVAEVATERLVRDLPVPDTGSLRGDLTGWAGNVARNLNSRKNSALLRIMTATARASRTARDLNSLPIGRRIAELEAMLLRARERGEYAPEIMDILDFVLAPIYLRVLFIGAIGEKDFVEKLVDRLLSSRIQMRPQKK